jgi:hypothetical protein
VDIRRPFSRIVTEFLGDFLAFDARIWRTLVPLFFRPGALTRDYLAGRRASYVPPLKLYVFAGFAFFAVMAVTGGGQIRFIAVGPSERVETRSDSLETEDGGEGGGWFAEEIELAVRDPDRYQAAVVGALGYAHVLLLPLLALLLKLFWRRRYYAEHLVFSAHFHTFVLLTGALVVAGYALSGGSNPEGLAAKGTMGAWMLASAAYLFVALRRIYGGRWWAIPLKFVLLGFLYLLLLTLVVGGVAVLSVITL